jgi:hypothetical protein
MMPPTSVKSNTSYAPQVSATRDARGLMGLALPLRNPLARPLESTKPAGTSATDGYFFPTSDDQIARDLASQSFKPDSETPFALRSTHGNA